MVVVSERYPHFPVRVEIRGESRTGWALVDTGFDGGLIIPTSWLEIDLGREDGQARWQVADGRGIFAPIYHGDIEIPDFARIEGYPCSVLGDQYILGRDIIDRYKVTFDHGRRLIIEP